MTPIMRDGKSIGRRRHRRFLWQAVRRQRQAALRRRSGGVSVRRQGFRKHRVDPWRQLGRHPGRTERRICGAALRRDATLNGHPAALYLGQIKNYAGQPVAVIELVKDTTEYEAAAASSQRSLILGTLAIWPAPPCWRSCSAAACRGRWRRSPP